MVTEKKNYLSPVNLHDYSWENQLKGWNMTGKRHVLKPKTAKRNDRNERNETTEMSGTTTTKQAQAKPQKQRKRKHQDKTTETNKTTKMKRLKRQKQENFRIKSYMTPPHSVSIDLGNVEI